MTFVSQSELLPNLLLLLSLVVVSEGRTLFLFLVLWLCFEIISLQIQLTMQVAVGVPLQHTSVYLLILPVLPFNISLYKVAG